MIISNKGGYRMTYKELIEKSRINYDVFTDNIYDHLRHDTVNGHQLVEYLIEYAYNEHHLFVELVNKIKNSKN